MDTVNDKTIKRYVLGDLAASKMEQIESKIFNDDNFFEIVEAIEDEIIDDYINNKLSLKYRKLFEKQYSMNPKYQQRLKFAQSMQKSEIFRPPRSRGSILALLKKNINQVFQLFQRIPEPVMATAFLILVIVNIWLIVDINVQHNQLSQLKAKITEREKSESALLQQIDQFSAKNKQLSRQLELELFQNSQLQERLLAQPNERPTTTVLKLRPGLVRNTTTPEQLIIEKDLQLVTLQLQFIIYDDEKYLDYRADLKTMDNHEILTQHQLQAEPEGDHQLINLQLPANIFNDDDYMLTISGKTLEHVFETIETYYFSAVKK